MPCPASSALALDLPGLTLDWPDLTRPILVGKAVVAVAVGADGDAGLPGCLIYLLPRSITQLDLAATVLQVVREVSYVWVGQVPAQKARNLSGPATAEQAGRWLGWTYYTTTCRCYGTVLYQLLYQSSPDRGELGSRQGFSLLSRRLWRTGRDADAVMQGYPIRLLAVDRLWIALPGTSGALRGRREEKN